MRIRTVGYIRQIMNIDDVHFVARKQKSQFKLKSQVVHFIANMRVASKEVDVLLK